MADWVSNRSPEQFNRHTLLKVWRFFVAGSQPCSKQPDAKTRRKTIARQNQITVPPFFLFAVLFETQDFRYICSKLHSEQKKCA